MQTDLPVYVRIDPVAFQLGPLPVHWYGIMYLLAFLAFWKLGQYRANKSSHPGWNSAEIGDFIFYGILGVIIGGRLGYVLFYSLDSFFANPLFLFKINQGGMSFHGGFLGVLAAVAWYANKTGRGFLNTADFIVPLVAPGLMLGRLGNFIGGELWGRKTDVPWGMIFPNSLEYQGWQSEPLYQLYLQGALNAEIRHPSQLYQAGLEGLLLFLIVWFFSARQRPTGAVSWMFLAGYGLFRFLVEFFREPDAHIRFVAFDWLTMGQLLSLPMFVAGVILLFRAYQKSTGSR